MNAARTVAQVLSEHVTYELEGIDRMYLNVQWPRRWAVPSLPACHRGRSATLTRPSLTNTRDPRVRIVRSSSNVRSHILRAGAKLAAGPLGWDIPATHATKLRVIIPTDRRLAIALPESVPSGPAELIVLVPGGDEASVEQLGPRVPGSAKGQLVIRDDFDDPLDEFEPYTR